MEKSQEKPVYKESDLKNLIAVENKVQNIMDLPDEILLKILGYLSNIDILRKMAPVSKRFYRLSWDQNFIKNKIKSEKIE